MEFVLSLLLNCVGYLIKPVINIFRPFKVTAGGQGTVLRLRSPSRTQVNELAGGVSFIMRHPFLRSDWERYSHPFEP